MSRPDYWQIRRNATRQTHVNAIAQALGIDPTERGSVAKVIEFALAECYLRVDRERARPNSNWETHRHNVEEYIKYAS